MKPGFKTTEFWLAVLSTLLPIVKQYAMPTLPVEATYAVVAYIVGRALVKFGQGFQK